VRFLPCRAGGASGSSSPIRARAAESGGEGGHWRLAEDLPPAGQIQNSPDDPDARDGKKRDSAWVGYNVHVTETCDPDTPHLLVQVTTTPGATADETMRTPIQEDVARHALLPSMQLVDAGYIDAEGLATRSAQFGVDLVGPTRGDYRWQAHPPESLHRRHFVIDWLAHQVTCPEGRTSTGGTAAYDRRPRVPRAVINVKFARADCRACPSRGRCTQKSQRTLTLHPKEQEEAVRAVARGCARRGSASRRQRSLPPMRTVPGSKARRPRACASVAGGARAPAASPRPTSSIS
jgi:transposase